jgi:maltose O-acetyltransferase
MMSEREKMLAGQPYHPLDRELLAARSRAHDLCSDLNATREAQHAHRAAILQELLGSIGKNTWIQPPFFCDYGAHIHLGKRVFFNVNCVILDSCEVRIGDYCFFGPNVQIYTATHPMDARERRKFELAKPIVVEDDVWVGGGAILCPGIRIGKGSVIGAGSVVTRDIPPGVFAAGNPCRTIRSFS